MELSDETSSWRYSVRFDSAALKRADLVPIVTPVMESMVPAQELREVALTVLGELFTNALDHGVLGLSSDLKHGDGGLERYLSARTEALAGLSVGSVAVSLHSEQNAGGGRILIKVEDSGPGFTPTEASTPSGDSSKPSGRGISLVQHLGTSVDYNERGNEVEAVLSW